MGRQSSFVRNPHVLELPPLLLFSIWDSSDGDRLLINGMGPPRLEDGSLRDPESSMLKLFQAASMADAVLIAETYCGTRPVTIG
jgi:hypothetical protein